MNDCVTVCVFVVHLDLISYYYRQMRVINLHKKIEPSNHMKSQPRWLPFFCDVSEQTKLEYADGLVLYFGLCPDLHKKHLKISVSLQKLFNFVTGIHRRENKKIK